MRRDGGRFRNRDADFPAVFTLAKRYQQRVLSIRARRFLNGKISRQVYLGTKNSTYLHLKKGARVLLYKHSSFVQILRNEKRNTCSASHDRHEENSFQSAVPVFF